MPSLNEKNLTKKDKKALAFRANKGKGKLSTEGKNQQEDVPESEDLDQLEREDVFSSVNSIDDKKKRLGEGSSSRSSLVTLEKEPIPSDKKRKRVVESGSGTGGVVDSGEGKSVVDVIIEGDGERKKKRQRGKKKSEQRAAKLEEGKSRLILFVGNLPFKVTVEEIIAHFSEVGEVPVVRLLTPKPTSTSTTTRTKGCCFLEFTRSPSLQAALRLHESDMGGRQINVELSAGGGGNSVLRKSKIGEGRKRMEGERERTKLNKAKREGGEVVGNDKAGRWKTTEVVDDTKKGSHTPGTKKVRDRRIVKKVDGMTGIEKERARKHSAKALASTSGANTIIIQ